MSEQRHFAPLRGRLLEAESMARHTSWRAGGTARQAYVPADTADLQSFLERLPSDSPVVFIGLGSNTLVRDGGFAGTIVLMHDTRGRIGREGDRVFAAASVASPKVARFAANEGFEGAEFLAGIPGTIGGALAMNAGCYGAETWEVVRRVQTIDRAGKLRLREAAEFRWGYRHVEMPGNEWFLAAWFEFRPGDAVRARERIKSLLARRIASQPLNLPNAGSVFRNPPGDHAARLIEAAGLKGYAIGGARISEKHANFIVNPGGGASATDIERLIEHARATVRERFEVDLIAEVRIIGEPR